MGVVQVDTTLRGCINKLSNFTMHFNAVNNCKYSRYQHHAAKLKKTQNKQDYQSTQLTSLLFWRHHKNYTRRAVKHGYSLVYQFLRLGIIQVGILRGECRIPSTPT